MRHMNTQLCVICIKVVFDVRVRSNNLSQMSGEKKNSRGPKTEPCGTLNSSSCSSERVYLILIAWKRWPR